MSSSNNNSPAQPSPTNNHNNRVESKPKKSPCDTAFKQERLPACHSTGNTLLPLFFVIGILFIPIGATLFYFSNNLEEIIIDYTNCLSVDNSSKSCAEEIADWNLTNGSRGVKPCCCEEHFQLKTDWNGEVLIYYGLTNFYQNHRRYVKSTDDKQLLGETSKSSSQCAPYSKDNGTRKSIWPCGSIANSMFQDEIKLLYGPENKTVPLTSTGIAWKSDKQLKFINPKEYNATTFKNQTSFLKPLAWQKSPFELDPNQTENNGLANEDFVIWMRIAALPNFRKLFRKVSHKGKVFANGLPKGNYTLKINYSFRVKSFKGTKSIIISTKSIFGSKNPILGIGYIAVGVVSLVIGIMFKVAGKRRLR